MLKFSDEFAQQEFVLSNSVWFGHESLFNLLLRPFNLILPELIFQHLPLSLRVILLLDYEAVEIFAIG